MNPNTHSSEWSGGLDRLAAAVDQLAAEDPDALPDAQAPGGCWRCAGCWNDWKASGCGNWPGSTAAAPPAPTTAPPAESTAGWLRHRTRMGHPGRPPPRSGRQRPAPRPLQGTAQALADGELSYAHAAALTRATQHLPSHTVAAAEPVLLDATRRLDPPRLRKVVGHLGEVADPAAAEQQALRRHERRGLWLAPTLAGMVAIEGLLDPDAGETLLTALEPLARPSTADDDRSATQRRADALTELARRQLEGGRLPQSGGVRPQVTVELASLPGQPGLPGGRVAVWGRCRRRPQGGWPATRR